MTCVTDFPACVVLGVGFVLFCLIFFLTNWAKKPICGEDSVEKDVPPGR